MLTLLSGHLSGMILLPSFYWVIKSGSPSLRASPPFAFPPRRFLFSFVPTLNNHWAHPPWEAWWVWVSMALPALEGLPAYNKGCSRAVYGQSARSATEGGKDRPSENLLLGLGGTVTALR